MTTEAVAAIGAQLDQARSMQQSGPAVGETIQISDIPGSAATSRSAEVFSNVLSDVHANVEKLGADPAVQNGTRENDAVRDAKEALLPSPWVLHPAGPGAEHAANMKGGDQMIGVLSKSFDHAVFLSLVGQVVGGLSHATSSLIKQA
ncbi:MAG: hypothetical protein R3D02_08960 [Hyphomicrobiales bacterium]